MNARAWWGVNAGNKPNQSQRLPYAEIDTSVRDDAVRRGEGAMPKTTRAHFVAALEQLAPAEAVAVAALADDSGFAGAVVFDRYQPWLPQQGEASFCWTVAGAIATQISGAVTVSAVPGYRMHPAVVAQASATVAALVPGRHTLQLSSGDAIDEHITGTYWPEAPERAARLFESADIVRKLFAGSGRGGDTRHAGAHYRVESARLWTMPAIAPRVQVWAGGPVTARRAGREGLGIVMQAGPADRMMTLLRAFRDGQREGRHTDTEATVYAQLSWGATDDEAMANALADWPMAGLRFPRGDIRSPFDVAQLARTVTAADIAERIPVSASPEVHRRHLESLRDMGFDNLHVHNVGRNQREWIATFAEHIAPSLHG